MVGRRWSSPWRASACCWRAGRRRSRGGPRAERRLLAPGRRSAAPAGRVPPRREVEGMGGPIVITGGGTGGHVFPGLSLARALSARGHQVVFVGTEEGPESRLLPEAGFEF